MRKKFFAVYALVGALVAAPVFTSCIDGEESASVTAVRNAKAEAIKAQTEINKANAEYDAKIKEYQLALNKINLESNQLSLEQKKIEFEKIQAQTEQAIVQAKYWVAYYTKDLLTQQDEILTSLTSNYTTALDDVMNHKQAILKKNADIVALEQGIVGVQDHIASETERLNGLIESAEATIALWKDAESTDKTGLTEKIAALDELKGKLEDEQDALEARYGAIPTTVAGLSSTQVNDIKLATVKAAKALKGMPGTFTVNSDIYNKDFVTTDVDGYYTLKLQNVEAYKLYIEEQLATPGSIYDIEAAEKALALAIAALGTEADKADTKYQSDDTHLSLTKYAELAAAKAALEAEEKVYAPLKEAYDKALAAKNEKETALNEATAAEVANTDATKAQALADAKAAAQTAYAAAVTAYTAADAALTTPIIDAYEDAIDAVENAEIAVAAAKDNVATKQSDLASIKASVENMGKFESYIAAFEGEDYAAYKAAVDALAAKADEIKEIDLEKAVLEELNGAGYIDVAAKIADLEEDIEGYKEEIAALEKTTLTLPSVGTMGGQDEYSEADIEVLIEFVKEQIATLEIKLELAEARAELAKAALDAYLEAEE